MIYIHFYSAGKILNILFEYHWIPFLNIYFSKTNWISFRIIPISQYYIKRNLRKWVTGYAFCKVAIIYSENVYWIIKSNIWSKSMSDVFIRFEAILKGRTYRDDFFLISHHYSKLHWFSLYLNILLNNFILRVIFCHKTLLQLIIFTWGNRKCSSAKPR